MDKLYKKVGILGNKKGEVTDTITFTFWAFVIIVGLISIMFAFLTFVSPLKESVLGDDPDTLSAINSMESYIGTSLPSAGLIVYFGLILGIIFSSFFVRQHPIFIVIYILFSFASIFVAVVLGNVWANITSIEEFSEIVELNTYTQILDVIMNNLVLMTILVFILSLVITFAKPGGAQVQQLSEPY